MEKLELVIYKGFGKTKLWFLFTLSTFLLFILLCYTIFPLSAGAIVCLDSACVGCHVVPTTAINVALTHPNLIAGCITCHSPECLAGFHKNGIRELDPLFYSYTGTAANIGCNVCHGAPPQALCVGGLVMDHCLDPAGCNPAIFNCIACHPNFNGTPAHIYPKVLGLPLFAPVASVAKCLACHSLSLFVGRSGVHGTHFISKIIAPATTLSTVLSIDCAVCHPDLTANLGADHLVCIPGTSNAWLPGKVPVIFNALLPSIGDGDFYSLGPIGGTGTCVVYCHSNGQTPPTNLLTAPLGYPGSFLPLPWNVPFPINPITLDCGCCHAFPPLTHTATKTDCNQCHPTPVLGLAPTSQYHINGIPDLWKYLAAAGPMILFIPPTLSPSSNDTILTAGLGLNKVFGVPGLSSNLETYDPGLALLSTFGMINLMADPFMALALSNSLLNAPAGSNLAIGNLPAGSGLSIANNSLTGLNYTSLMFPGLYWGGFGSAPGLMPWSLSNGFSNYNSSPASSIFSPQIGNSQQINNLGLNNLGLNSFPSFLFPPFSPWAASLSFMNPYLINPLFQFGGFGPWFF